MEKRNRNRQLKIRLTDEEHELFQKKFAMSQSKNMGHFIRKCVLEKDIYVVDMDVFYRLQHLLAKDSNNLNQIAKQVNTTGVIYRDDIEYLKQINEDLSKRLVDIQQILLKNLAKRGD